MFLITNKLLIYDAPATLDTLPTDEIVDFVPSDPKELEVECSVCLDKLSDVFGSSGKKQKASDASSSRVPPVQIQKCSHKFHRHCLEDCFQNYDHKCPLCRIDVVLQGSSPTGVFEVKSIASKCPGFDTKTTAIQLKYKIPQGTQRPYHYHPGNVYQGTTRMAYLPDNEEGRNLLLRMQYAWMCGLTFTIGTSMTTGRQDVVVWNTAFHHKTSLHGGTFGFPDPNYISSNNKFLDQLGVPNADSCRAELPTLISKSNQRLRSASAPTAPPVPAAPSGPAALIASAASASSSASSAASVSSAGSSGFWSNRSAAVADFAAFVENLRNSSGASSSANTHNLQSHYNKRETLTYNAPNVLQSGVSSIIDSYCEATAAAVAGDDNGGSNYYCSICFDALSAHHRETKCPICRTYVGKPQGKCPSGTMSIVPETNICPGFTAEGGGSCLAIQISYVIPYGWQRSYHDNPGRKFDGTTRIAYLPNNNEGRQLLARLKYAWMHGLIFSVGTSLTTGRSNVVVWTSIHHKTSLYGGPHGFPDPNYLFNCNSQLDALGVPTDPAECLEELAKM